MEQHAAPIFIPSTKVFGLLRLATNHSALSRNFCHCHKWLLSTKTGCCVSVSGLLLENVQLCLMNFPQNSSGNWYSPKKRVQIGWPIRTLKPNNSRIHNRLSRLHRWCFVWMFYVWVSSLKNWTIFSRIKSSIRKVDVVLSFSSTFSKHESRIAEPNLLFRLNIFSRISTASETIRRPLVNFTTHSKSTQDFHRTRNLLKKESKSKFSIGLSDSNNKIRSIFPVPRKSRSIASVAASTGEIKLECFSQWTWIYSKVERNFKYIKGITIEFRAWLLQFVCANVLSACPICILGRKTTGYLQLF